MSTLMMTYKMGTRDGRGSFTDKVARPLASPAAGGLQTSLKFYFEGWGIEPGSTAMSVTKVPANFGGRTKRNELSRWLL
jgi:hypothetical protein